VPDECEILLRNNGPMEKDQGQRMGKIDSQRLSNESEKQKKYVHHPILSAPESKEKLYLPSASRIK
jgi:hypothetical protein